MKPINITIGRAETNDIVYTTKTVSRQHAILRQITDDSFVLEDLNSTNGTLVNNDLISAPVTVNFEDKVCFGSQQLDWNDVKKIIPENSVPQKQPKAKRKKSFHYFPYLLLGAGIILLFNLLLNTNIDENKTIEYNEITAIDTTAVGLYDSIASETSEQSPHTNTVTKDKIEQVKYKPKHHPLVYSISCLRSQSVLNEIIGIGAEVEDGFIKFSSDEIGVNEEIKVGLEVKKGVTKEYDFNTDEVVHQRITNIFNRLLNVLENPKMDYRFYIIESSNINAFTAGGLIFITTGIIDFAANDDELACVIGHEIYHNELGHINKLIRKEKAAKNWLGDFADWGLIASNIMGASFNQENEVYCDLYGADLTIKAGYDGKAAARFWSRMESQNNAVDKMLSTHPFSDERLECIEEHLGRNYWVE
ncbi:MAG: M48 family metalloprotease [Crocinitomicaceae bacterium]|nr:M48 family metalloprotease [Crocinitomicaceae bacterium]